MRVHSIVTCILIRVIVNFFSSRRSPSMPLTSKRLAGPGFIILNVLRAMNITALLSVIAASMIMVIKTFTASKVFENLALYSVAYARLTCFQFFFFDGATHCLTAISSSMFLFCVLTNSC